MINPGSMQGLRSSGLALVKLKTSLFSVVASLFVYSQSMKKDIYTRLVYARRSPVIGGLAYYLLKFLGVEIPRPVKIGEDFELAHGGFGVVIHPRTTFGNRVKVYPGVSLGRADIFRAAEQSKFEGIVIEDDAILSPGSKILCKEGVLRVGRGTVVGANAVLLESTGENEIWAGMPASCVGKRDGNK
jgi:serine O-acetyltransferase